MIKDEHNVACKDFWKMWFAKLFRTIISVKLCVVVSMMTISTKALYSGKLSGGEFCTLMISGVVAIILSRSVFEISSLRSNGHTGEKE